MKAMEFIGDIGCIALGVILIIVFGMIASTGGVVAWEPNPYMIFLEFSMGIFFTAIGFERFYNDIQRSLWRLEESR